MTTFFVPGRPAPKGSRIFFRNGGSREVSPYEKQWETTVGQTARHNIHQPHQDAVTVTIEFVMPRPKSWGKKREDPHTVKPDIDKLARATLDGLTGIAFIDDRQVTKLTATKRRAHHGENTGAKITVDGTGE